MVEWGGCSFEIRKRGSLRSAYDMTAREDRLYEENRRSRRISGYEADRDFEDAIRRKYDLLNELRDSFPYSVNTLDDKDTIHAIPDEATARFYLKKIGQFVPEQYGGTYTHQYRNLRFASYMALFGHMLRSGFAHLVTIEAFGILSECLEETRLSICSDIHRARTCFLDTAQQMQPFSEAGARLDEELTLKILEGSPRLYDEIDSKKRERAIVYLLDNRPYGSQELKDLSRVLGNKYTEEQIIRAEARILERAPNLDKLKKADEFMPENSSWRAYGLIQTQNYAAKLTSPIYLEALRGTFGFSPSPEDMEQAMYRYLEGDTWNRSRWGRGPLYGSSRQTQGVDNLTLFSSPDQMDQSLPRAYLGWDKTVDGLHVILNDPALSGQTPAYREIGARYLASKADRAWQIDQLKTAFNYRASVQEILDMADRLVERIKGDPRIMRRGLD